MCTRPPPLTAAALGSTVAELNALLVKDDTRADQSVIVAKTRFSMVEPGIMEALGRMEPRRIAVLFGLEVPCTPLPLALFCPEMRCFYFFFSYTALSTQTHICILQTALDLSARGYAVHVVADAVASRNQIDRHFAFEVCPFLLFCSRKAGRVTCM